MTNLQQGAGGVSGALLRRFWVGLPIAAGGLLALLLTAFVLLPQWLGLQRDIKRQAELEELRSELALMRAQLNTSETSTEKAQAQQAKLFEIVTGNGDLSTFMAMVDREARLAGVQLDLFEPQLGGGPAPVGPGGKPAPAPPAAAAAKPGAAPAQPAAGGVVEISGLKRQSILVSARGPFPALLDFLRRLEKLNVLVVQSDLRLLMEESKPAEGVAPTQTVVLKVLLSLYGRPTPAAAIPGTPAPGAPAPAGTVPPAAPAAGAPPAPAPPPAAAAPSPPAPPAPPSAPPTTPAPAPSR